ncbi:MAG: hypothetical protein RL344_1504 [Pseudomonadota bacterium]|jgi:hypothetical protein
MTINSNPAKRLLKSELIKKGISSKKLTILLNNNGFIETNASVANKISRGNFSADFFLNCLYAIQCTSLIIEILNVESSHSNQMISHLPSKI